MKSHIPVEMFYVLGQPTDLLTSLASFLYDKIFSTAVFSKHLAVNLFPPLLAKPPAAAPLPQPLQRHAAPPTDAPAGVTMCPGTRPLGPQQFPPGSRDKLSTRMKSLEGRDQLYPPLANPARTLQLPRAVKRFPPQLLCEARRIE